MTTTWRTFLLVLALALAPDGEASACSCFPTGPPCQAAWSADVVFAGTVRAVEEISHDELGAPYRSLLVTFDVERGFIDAPAGRLEVVTGSTGASCGFAFSVGAPYLVYASKTASSRLHTGICSRTRPLAQAREDLEYLASLPSSAVGARVYGRIREYRRHPAEPESVDYGPVEGITVSVRGATFVREAMTDVHGRYEILNLPTGAVTVNVVPPFGFETRYLEREFEVKDTRSCREEDFRISPIAGASGRVVDAAGRPLGGVEVDAIAAELAGFAPPPFQRPVRTDAFGVFEFSDLPPGEYILGISLTKPSGRSRPGPALFLPGTAVVKDATIFELKPGDRRDVGVLRLNDR